MILLHSGHFNTNVCKKINFFSLIFWLSFVEHMFERKIFVKISRFKYQFNLSDFVNQ